MNEDVSRLYTTVIRKHANQPRNCHRLTEANRRAWSKNPLCGDCVTIHLRVESGVIRAAAFESFGCALCRASASLLTEAVKGLRLEEASELVKAVETMVAEGDSGACREGELTGLAGVHEFPGRIKCVLLPWRTLAEAVRPEPSG
jgi:nitrogen fixation NifU-like protein